MSKPWVYRIAVPNEDADRFVKMYRDAGFSIEEDAFEVIEMGEPDA